MEPKEVIEKIKEKESEGERLIEKAQDQKRRIIQKTRIEAEEIIKLKEKEAKEKAILIREKAIKEAKDKIGEIKKQTEVKKENLRESSSKNIDKATDFIIEEIKNFGF